MHRSVLVGLVVLALLASGMGAAMTFVEEDATPSDSAQFESTGDGDAALATASQSSVDDTDQEFDRTTFVIEVRSDGSAVWTFEYERSLATDEEVEEFRDFADRFESEETELYERFTEQASALVASGEEHTGREMTVDDFNRSTHVDDGRVNRMGVVEMSFTWNGFAVVDDEGRVVVSDVFDGGFYLMSDQALTIRAGDGLAFDEARPEPEYAARNLDHAEAVTWLGEMEFADSHPYVLMIPEDEAGAGDGGENGGGSSVDGVTLASVALVLAVIGLAAFAWRRSDDWPLGGRRDPDSTAASESAAPIPTDSPDESVADEELMSDEDRVVSLIRQNGGRMKQVNIVDETGWSKSKVSMLLSDMEDDGTISKLRVGRENIISLEGFEPEATKSPFDE
ncbi:hypothetical protein [Halovivax sp.]|uniref:DUF7343 domain-containing protein n=1 Tax=Halovivax sp. TaxID=1935978 RepID=UPI0025C6BC1F|nr:hypothetical protein [Halovivax sp.]